MFQHPLFMTIAVGIVIAGVIFLIASYQRETKLPDTQPEPQTPGWQVQCPQCSRWKKMPPVRREELLDEVEALERSVLHGTHHRFLYEYKCRFCGHTWQEHYPV